MAFVKKNNLSFRAAIFVAAFLVVLTFSFYKGVSLSGQCTKSCVEKLIFSLYVKNSLQNALILWDGGSNLESRIPDAQ